MSALRLGYRFGMRLPMVLVALLCFAIQTMAFASVGGISEVRTLDNDHNGKVDHVQITFSENVNIIDSDATQGFTPIRLLNEKLKVLPGDYSANNVNVLVLPVQEGDVFNTGMITGARYENNTGMGNVVLLSASQEIPHLQQQLNGVDGAAPVITEFFTTDSVSGEVFIRFSEPVKNGVSTVLTISDFNYTDVSGNGASSLSAMG